MYNNLKTHKIAFKIISAIALICFIATSVPIYALQKELISDNGLKGKKAQAQESGKLQQAWSTVKMILTTDVRELGELPGRLDDLKIKRKSREEEKKLLEEFNKARLEEIQPQFIANRLETIDPAVAREILMGLEPGYASRVLSGRIGSDFGANFLKILINTDYKRAITIINNLQMDKKIQYINEMGGVPDTVLQEIVYNLSQEDLIYMMSCLTPDVGALIFSYLRLIIGFDKARSVLLASNNAGAAAVYLKGASTQARIILSNLPDGFRYRLFSWYVSENNRDGAVGILYDLPAVEAAKYLSSLNDSRQVLNIILGDVFYRTWLRWQPPKIMLELYKINAALVDEMFYESLNENILLLRRVFDDDDICAQETAKAMKAVIDVYSNRSFLLFLMKKDSSFASMVVAALERIDKDLVERLYTPRYQGQAEQVADIMGLIPVGKIVQILNKLALGERAALMQELNRKFPKLGRQVFQSPNLDLSQGLKMLAKQIFERRDTAVSDISWLYSDRLRFPAIERIQQLGIQSASFLLSFIGIAHYGRERTYEKLEPDIIFSEENIENKQATMFLLMATGFNVYVHPVTKTVMLRGHVVDDLFSFFRGLSLNAMMAPAADISLSELFYKLGLTPSIELERQLKAFCKSRDGALMLEKFKGFDQKTINAYYVVYFSQVHLDRITSKEPLVAPYLSINDEFDGYRILKMSNGGTSNVYEVVGLNTKEIRCLKMFKPPSDPADWEYYEEMFDAESEILKQLSKEPAVENVVRWYDYQSKANPQNTQERIKYMVLEYIDGPTLAKLREGKAGPIVLADLIGYFFQAAQIVGHCHERGVIHRDITPDNIIVKNGISKLIDFGLANSHRHAVYRSDREPMGTPGFFAPEQLESLSKTNVQSDIFSLGAVLYFVLKGEPLEYKLKADTDGRLVVDSILQVPIDPQIDAVIKKATELLPYNRYHSVKEFLEALVPAAVNGAIIAVPAMERAQETMLLEASI